MERQKDKKKDSQIERKIQIQIYGKIARLNGTKIE